MARVAITGIGLLSPLGRGPQAVFDGALAGRSAVTAIAAPYADQLQVGIAAQVAFDPAAHFPKAKYGALDRVSQFALVSAGDALDDAGIDAAELDPERAGVHWGTGMGGAATLDESYVRIYREGAARTKPLTVPMVMNNAAAAHIALEHGWSGPNLTYSTACSSSAVAIGEAARRIRHGEADLMLAGGAEALLTYGTLLAWEALRTLAMPPAEGPASACRPFAQDRSGFVLGEGAACLVLEDWERARKRGARIYAELTGYGLANDAGHLTLPSAAGQALALRRALADARLDAADIGYINAHGTGTQANDATETAALKLALGAAAPSVPVSSTKAVHGHLLGAAGALEFAIAVLALARQAIPPTAHLWRLDAACDLDYVPLQGREARIDHALSQSFAFGGTGAVLVASKVS